MKMLRTRIAEMGFKALTKSVHVCRHGDLLHTVMVNKDRYGGDTVSVLVSIPSFFDQDAALTVETLQSPLSGDISPRGVLKSFSWDKGSLDEELVARTIAGFFKHFASADDVRNALAGHHVYPYFSERLSIDAQPIPAMSDLPEAHYPVAGGARSSEDVKGVVRSKLLAALAGEGFSLAARDAVAIRGRGEMFDGVSALIDDYGTYLTVSSFPWPKAVWQADKNWKGAYYPMLSFPVLDGDKPRLFGVDEFVNLESCVLRELIRTSQQLAARVRDSHQFAAALGSDWRQMAEKLYRLPAK